MVAIISLVKLTEDLVVEIVKFLSYVYDKIIVLNFLIVKEVSLGTSAGNL